MLSLFSPSSPHQSGLFDLMRNNKTFKDEKWKKCLRDDSNINKFLFFLSHKAFLFIFIENVLLGLYAHRQRGTQNV